MLRDRVEAATGATRAGILLNWNHTHHAPPGGVSVHGSFGERVMEPDASTAAYVEHLHGRVVEVCRLACERLEPRGCAGGSGEADEAINRRERDPDGQVRRIGWHPDGMADITRAGAAGDPRGRQRRRHGRRATARTPSRPASR